MEGHSVPIGACKRPPGPQGTYPFEQAFLDTLAHNYGSDLRPVDFNANTADARRQINSWAEEASAGHVEDIVPPGELDPRTKLVLTNAVRLRADWQQPFDTGDTEAGEFTRPDGSRVRVPLMNQTGEFPYLWRQTDQPDCGIGYNAVELPYIDNTVSMVLLLPARGNSLAELERVIDPSQR